MTPNRPALPCPVLSFTNSQASCQLCLLGRELTRTSGGSLARQSISEGWGRGFPHSEDILGPKAFSEPVKSALCNSPN